MIDDQSDATFLPLISTEAGPQFDIEYRRRFNDGTLLVNTSAGYLDGSPQGSFASRGQFSYDDTWRYGFDINRASSTTYVTDFHLTEGLTGDPNILSSQLYLEGFGDGSYTRLYFEVLPGTEHGHRHQRTPNRVTARPDTASLERPTRWAAGSRSQQVPST